MGKRKKKKKHNGTHFPLDVLADLIVNLQFLLLFVKLFFTNLSAAIA